MPITTITKKYEGKVPVSEVPRKTRRIKDRQKTVPFVGIKKKEPETPFEYLVTHAEPKERFLLSRIEKAPGAKFRYVASQVAGRKAYESLTPKEKAEFGYQYTEWEKIPVEERRFYPGGIRHLKTLPISEQEQLGSQFAEEHIEHDPWWAFGSTWKKDGEPIPLAGFRVREYMKKGFTEKQALSKIGWEELSITDTGTMTYKKMPLHMRSTLSAGQAFSQTILWPVTLGQTGVKFLTGGKTFLPDVGTKLKKRQVGPSGIISIGISEGIGAVTGQKSMEWETAQKYPVETGFATVGEIAGFLFGSKIAKGFYTGGKLGVKFSVRAVPKLYGKVSSYTGTRFTYLTGGRFAKAPTFGTKIGQTKFGQSIQAWAKGEKVFVKTYPVVKGFPKTFREGDRFARIWKFKGFGKRELVPRSSITQLGKSGEGFLRFGGGPKSEFRMVFEDVTAKGFFRKTITQRYASSGVTMWEKGATVPYYIKGTSQVPFIAVKKAPVISKGLWKDTSAYQPLTTTTVLQARSMLGRMHHVGFLGDSISIPASSFSSLSFSALGLGYGLSQVDASAYGQRRELGKIQQPDFASALRGESAYDVVPVQATDMVQLQEQAYRKKYALLTETVSIPALSPGRKAATVPYHGLGPGIKIPKIIPITFDDGMGKKKKKQWGIDWTKGYRERKWKVLSMEEFVKGVV